MNTDPDDERINVGERVVIVRRGKKRIWTAEFYEGGQHRRQSLKTSNKKIALGRASQLAADLSKGEFAAKPKNITIDEASNQYIDYLRSEHRRPKTITKYKGILASLGSFAEKRMAKYLHQVTVSLFDAYRANRRDNCSQKTLYTESVVIKQILRWAKSRKLVAENPLESIRLQKPSTMPKQRPSLTEVNSILALASEPARTMLATLAFTGMRIGQLQLLRPQDVGLVENWIAIQPVEGAKTHHLVRVPIHPRLRPLLEALPQRERPWFFTAKPSRKYPDGNHRVSAKRLGKKFESLCKKAGLPTGRVAGYTVHSLRGFFETHCANTGTPQRAIDTWLGHRSDKSMGSVYYCLRDAESQALMGKVPFGDGTTARDVA